MNHQNDSSQFDTAGRDKLGGDIQMHSDQKQRRPKINPHVRSATIKVSSNKKYLDV